MQRYSRDNFLIYAFLRHSLRRHFCRVEHIFDKNAVAHRRIIYHNVGDPTSLRSLRVCVANVAADKLAVLNDGRAAHECGQERTTVFCKIFIKLAHRLDGGALFLSVLNNL